MYYIKNIDNNKFLGIKSNGDEWWVSDIAFAAPFYNKDEVEDYVINYMDNEPQFVIVSK